MQKTKIEILLSEYENFSHILDCMTDDNAIHKLEGKLNNIHNQLESMVGGKYAKVLENYNHNSKLRQKIIEKLKKND